MSILIIVLSTRTDWEGLKDHLKDVSWLGIFKHAAIYAAKEITELVEIGIDCHIPHRKFQPHSLPWFTPSFVAAIAHRNHQYHQYHWNAIPENKKLVCDSVRVLKDARSNYVETTRRSGGPMV